MVKRRRMSPSTWQLRAALDGLSASDPEAYAIGHELTYDFIAVQNGHRPSMAGGRGQKLYDRASPDLQKRAVQMFKIILRLISVEFDQPPTRRRYWRRRK